jgi:hypothetical protein
MGDSKMYHEYCGTQRKHYNGQRLGAIVSDVTPYTDPDSDWWKAQYEKSFVAFCKLPISDADFDTFQSFIPDVITWKEAHCIYSQAAATWKPGITIEALAHDCGILPENRQ